MTIPPLGLLLDVDGPIASPVSRTIAIPSILHDLVTLADAGVPIAFITGRSDAFIRDKVVAPLLEAGLGGPKLRMFGVFEKGGAWAPITDQGMQPVVVDSSLALPVAFSEEIRELVDTEFADFMFFDDTKRAMVSVEQRTDVENARYKDVQPRFEEAAFDALQRHGLGARFGDREHPDAAGRVPYRIDTTIISTDIESVTLDKDRGAERALEYFASNGEFPHVWRSVGDSRSDYLMADFVHAAGHSVAHLDVRPADGILERPYDVLVQGDLIHDDAGAAFLRHWVEELERA